MLLEWLAVAAIVAVALVFAVRSLLKILNGKKACCEEGASAGCQLVDLMKSHNLPEPRSCNGKPLTGPEAVEEYKRRMGERQRAAAAGQPPPANHSRLEEAYRRAEEGTVAPMSIEDLRREVGLDDK